jgi:hypothetical protein
MSRSSKGQSNLRSNLHSKEEFTAKRLSEETLSGVGLTGHGHNIIPSIADGMPEFTTHGVTYPPGTHLSSKPRPSATSASRNLTRTCSWKIKAPDFAKMSHKCKGWIPKKSTKRKGVKIPHTSRASKSEVPKNKYLTSNAPEPLVRSKSFQLHKTGKRKTKMDDLVDPEW